MDTAEIEHALRRLGERLEYHQRVELLLVGGAAGMLTGVLPPSRTTIDCNVMVYVPASAITAVEQAADAVADELGLDRKWFNSDVQMRSDALPDGWEKRRVWVATWGLLHVYAASRIDLIAMKVLAGRVQDLADISAMRPVAEDFAFVEMYVRGLPSKGTPRSEVERAADLLRGLKESSRG